jgi:hypothetical protein
MKMIKKTLRKLVTIIFILLVMILGVSLILPYLYTLEIADWQIKNDNSKFILRGYLVPYLKNLETINTFKVLNIKTYERALINKADKKSISDVELKIALEKCDKRIDTIIIDAVPVFVETVYYEKKPTIAITYTNTHYYGEHTFQHSLVKNISLLKVLIKEEHISNSYVLILYDMESNSIVDVIY